MECIFSDEPKMFDNQLAGTDWFVKVRFLTYFFWESKSNCWKCRGSGTLLEVVEGIAGLKVQPSYVVSYV